MFFEATKIPYRQTGFFSKTVTDYLDNTESLRPFVAHPPHEEGLRKSIAARQTDCCNREVLCEALGGQYRQAGIADAVLAQIEALRSPNTFSITTAHQPNIFTGPLYFFYKIIHAIKLADYCKQIFPQFNFVPVYFMGSEDADLDELGHFFLDAEKLEWHTQQTGAVGRMKVDKNLLSLVDRMAGELGVQPFGDALMAMIRKNYAEGRSLQQATFGLVHDLFGQYGLVVLIPDQAALKKLAHNMFREELLNSPSNPIITQTGKKLAAAGIAAQAHSRQINLFYLLNDRRERIEKNGSKWNVVNTDIYFDETQLICELTAHPERFSPNVILRGVFQELVLPNIAFIGGGGELAYWLQLKDVFEFFKIPFPVLVLRNSFLIVNKKNAGLMKQADIPVCDIFKPVHKLQNEWVQRNTPKDLDVSEAMQMAEKMYNTLAVRVKSIDASLLMHIEALKNKSAKQIVALEKKMLRAEKRNHEVAMRRIEKLKQQLFPFGSLQERIDNFSPFYSLFGSSFIHALYERSPALGSDFIVLQEAG